MSTKVKAILRWVYVLILYTLVTAGLYFWSDGSIQQTTFYPSNVDLLSDWLYIVHVVVLVTALISLLFFLLWNLLVNGETLGRYSTNDPNKRKCIRWNWIFQLLHLAAVVGWTYYSYGPAFTWMLSLTFGNLILYILPVVVYQLLFFFVSRTFGPNCGFCFYHLWKIRNAMLGK